MTLSNDLDLLEAEMLGVVPQAGAKSSSWWKWLLGAGVLVIGGVVIGRAPQGLVRKTYYRDEDWIPGKRDLTAKDSGSIEPRRLAHFAPQGNPLRKTGDAWRAFVEDIRANGVKNPVMVYVKPERGPYIDEGNHRLQAALEAKSPAVPVEIYYYGGTEKKHGP